MKTYSGLASSIKVAKLSPAVAVVFFFICAMPQAAEFEVVGGRVSGKVDSTLSYGVSIRTENPHPDQRLSGGNRNFDQWDIISNVVKGTHDLELSLGDNAGGFFRGTWYYDDANADAPLVDDAQTEAISDVDLLDAYGYIRLGPNREVTVRYGKQVISWGESIFIQGSLNVINPVDVSRLRTPGSELKEALLPTHAVDIQWRLTPDLSAELFYLFEFDETKIDPVGTFFDTSGFVGDGGFRLGPLARGKSSPPEDSKGQYGLALRYFAGQLLSGVEFGAYYMNLHSHDPYLGVVAGSPASTPPAPPSSPSEPSPTTARFFLDYPENVEMWGASFNTIIGPWAVGGEWSHRRNAPIQLDFIVEAALGIPTPHTGGAPAAIGQRIATWDRVRVDQIQLGAQRLWGPRFGASQFNTIGEFAYTWRGENPGIRLFEPVSDDAWGYQLRTSLEYNRVLFGIVNLIPGVAFRHDVSGNSTELGGKTFVDDRKSLTTSLGWSYLLTLTGEIAYTRNFGAAGERNSAGSLLHGAVDRDFISMNVSYQF